MRKFSLPKDKISDQTQKWENIVIVGSLNGQPQLVSTTDEATTQKLLERAQLAPVTSG